MKNKVEIEYDDALNQAGWELYEMISKFQHVEPRLFNNMKGCLKAAIETYLSVKSDDQ